MYILYFILYHRTVVDIYIIIIYLFIASRVHTGFPGSASDEEPACQCRRLKRCEFDPWVRNLPRGGHGSPLQYSCLENPMDRGAWWAMVHGVTKSWTRLNAHTHSNSLESIQSLN